MSHQFVNCVSYTYLAISNTFELPTKQYFDICDMISTDLC